MFFEKLIHDDISAYRFMFYKSNLIYKYQIDYKISIGEDFVNYEENILEKERKNQENFNMLTEGIESSISDVKHLMNDLISPIPLFFNSLYIWLVFKTIIVFSAFSVSKKVNEGKKDIQHLLNILNKDNLTNILLFCILFTGCFTLI